MGLMRISGWQGFAEETGRAAVPSDSVGSLPPRSPLGLQEAEFFGPPTVPVQVAA
jgi:hypothetical protein